MQTGEKYNNLNDEGCNLVTSRERQVLRMMDQEGQLSKHIVDNITDENLLKSLTLKGLFCDTGPCNSCNTLRADVLNQSNQTITADSPFSHIDLSDEVNCIKDVMLTSLKSISGAPTSQLLSHISQSNNMDSLIALFPSWESTVTQSAESIEIEHWVDQITNQFFPH